MAENASLAVCIIAKNEAKNIARAIASTKPIADEIIVVDTGSSDATVDIAQSLGARVIEHVWDGDFSKARNKAIEAARSDWLLFLDADEYLPEDSLEKIETVLLQDADAFYVRIESRLRSTAGKIFANSFPRLLRRLPGVRFEGRVHEQVLPSLERQGARVAPSGIVIKHTGYDLSRKQMREKLQRNQRLLEMQLEEKPDDGLTLFHLGEAHNLLGEHDIAARYYRKAISDKSLPQEIRAVCLQNLATALIKLGHYEEALRHLKKVKRLSPGLLTVHLVTASALFGQRLYDDAEAEIGEYLKKARGMKMENAYRLDFDPDVSSALVLIAKCKLAKGEIEAGRRVLKEALRMGDNYDAHVLSARIAFEELRFSDAVVHFEEALRLSDEDERLYFELSKSYLACGELTKAIEVITSAIHRGMGGSEFLKCLGILKIKARDFEGAIAAYEAALSKDPDDIDSRKKLAGLYHHLGKDEKALAILNAAN